MGVGWGVALSQSCPMVFLKLAMGAGGSLPALTEGGACACHCLLFHYYLHSLAAFTTLVSLCGHIETERDREYTLQGPNHHREFSFLMLFPHLGQESACYC